MIITKGHHENKPDSKSCVVMQNVSTFLARQRAGTVAVQMRSKTLRKEHARADKCTRSSRHGDGLYFCDAKKFAALPRLPACQFETALQPFFEQ
jgi:hypothetical protein